MYLTIISLPLLSSIICGLFGRLLGSKGSTLLSTVLVSLTALLSFIIFYEVGLSQSPVYVNIMTWITSGDLEIAWGLQYDSLTSIMLIVVTVVSALVHLYAIDYMKEDPHRARFMSYLSLFTFFMLILITADNFLQLFVGWEGVGLASYLLINFWYTRLSANKAALKAMIVNRIGDVGYVIGLISIYLTFKTLKFNTIFATISNENQLGTFNILGYEIDKVTIICLFLFIGAMGKSAQLGLHVWLPDAMEGPTPVSALIHAATMVTAGVFLIIRSYPLFEASPISLVVVTVIGAATAFYAATVGLVQNDLKRVVAYSTCSQLGYMVFACGISQYSSSLFHLMNHAFFKALLFLSAGAIIHAINDEQDLRKMGGLLRGLPITYTMMLIGSLSLMGFPYLTGYYSKDLVLELAHTTYTISGTFANWLGTLSAMLTAYYSIRLIALTFLTRPNTSKKLIGEVHEAPLNMMIPLILLAIGSIFIGYISKDLLIGVGSQFGSIALSQNTSQMIAGEFLSPVIKLLPVILSIIGMILGIVGYKNYSKLLIELKLKYKGIYAMLNKKWYFDIIYNELITKQVLKVGYNVTFKQVDRGILEMIGPYGISNKIWEGAEMASKLQTGNIAQYAFLMIIGITYYITILIMI